MKDDNLLLFSPEIFERGYEDIILVFNNIFFL